MNIIIVNHYAGSPSLGMEFRPYYLAKAWKKGGHNVIIVAGSFSHLRRHQPEVARNEQQEITDNVDYIWLKTNKYNGNGLGRIFSMLLFVYRLFRLSKKMLSTFRPDLIIASSTYPLDNLPAWWLARRTKALYCYEVHDLWPLSPMELGGYSKWNPYVMGLQWAENFAYKNADFVVSMLPNTLDHMLQHGLKKEKFFYIPNGVAIDEWDRNQPIPEAHLQVLAELRSQGKTIVGYVGGHSISNALNTLIDAAALAQESLPTVAFVLVGNGIEKPQLVRRAKDLNLVNIHFLDSVPKDSVPNLLSYMDILYLGWNRSPLYRFGISPNKLLDYMMAAKPIIHSFSGANDMVKDAGCGISVPAERADLIMTAIQEMISMPAIERGALGSRARNWVVKHNDYATLAQKFLDVVTDAGKK